MATRFVKPSGSPLAGWRVLVCRPQPEARELAIALESRGAKCHCLPLLQRQPIADNPQRRTLVQDLDNFQHVIAVSPGAARAFIDYAGDWWPQWPAGIRWYGVGSATGATLAQAGLTSQFPTDGHTSEHLLALPELASLEGERILLVKGEGGRNLLKDALIERGARVDTMLLYKRTCPDHSPTVIARALVDFDPHAIVVLSIETLNNLIRLSKNRHHGLKQCTLLVPAERVADAARDAGFEDVQVARNLTPDGLAQCLTEGLANKK